MLQSLISAMGIILLLSSYGPVGAVAPGDGWYYSDNGGYENSCPVRPCQTDCNVGYYRSGCSGNSTGICIPCNNNKPTDSYYSSRGNLISDCEWACDAGFVKSLSGLACVSNTLCTKTIPQFATYSNANAPNCDHQCSSGYFNAQASTNPTSCSVCPAGTYSQQGATTCTACPTGTFSVIVGSSSSTNCQLCPAGTYSTSAGASHPSVCLNCQAGTYSNEAGAGTVLACQLCPMGTASASTGASSADVCLPCTAGKYSDVTGRTVCTSCTAGTHASGSGSSKCTACIPNFYAPSSGMTSCTPCEICNTTGVYKAGCGPISSGYCTQCTNPEVQ
jgi:hypothetical protein